MGCASSKPTPPSPSKRPCQTPIKNRSKTPIKSATASVSTGEKLARMVVSKAREEEQRASAERAASTFAERYVTVPIHKSSDSIPEEKVSEGVELSAPTLAEDVAITVVESVAEDETENLSEDQPENLSVASEKEIVESVIISLDSEKITTEDISASEQDIDAPENQSSENPILDSVPVEAEVQEFITSSSAVEEESEEDDLSRSEDEDDESFTSAKFLKVCFQYHF